MKTTLAQKKQNQRDAEIAKKIQEGLKNRSELEKFNDKWRSINAQMREF
jgi:hypothetical protein